MALKRLNAEHYTAIGLLAMPKKERKTHEEIANECGVHRSTIFEWKKEPLFEAELKRQIVRNTIDKMPDIFESIPKHIIEDGNAAMLKTFLQAHGMLTDRLAVETSDGSAAKDTEELRQRIAEFSAKTKRESDGHHDDE